MLSLQENKTPLLLFAACLVSTGIIFAILFFGGTPRPAPKQLPVQTLEHAPPAHAEISPEALATSLPTSLPLYLFIQNSALEDIRAAWALPEAPSQIFSQGTVFLWQTTEASVTLNTEAGVLHYTNNAPAEGTALASLDAAISAGEAYLHGLPFFQDVELSLVRTGLVETSGGEGGEVDSWEKADLIQLSYGRRLNGLPLISADRPEGNLYMVSMDKNGVVRSLDALLFEIDSHTLPAIPLVPSSVVPDAIRKGEISFVSISDETAFLDINSLRDKTFLVKSIALGYFLNKEGGLAQPIYIIKGEVDYYGRPVEVTALYPAEVP